jgi:hypothetical protein
MFYAWFDRDAPSFEDMNTYSSQRRWGRFYIDAEGDPTIEFDLDLEDGGISPALFVDNLEYWDGILADF